MKRYLGLALAVCVLGVITYVIVGRFVSGRHSVVRSLDDKAEASSQAAVKGDEIVGDERDARSQQVLQATLHVRVIADEDVEQVDVFVAASARVPSACLIDESSRDKTTIVDAAECEVYVRRDCWTIVTAVANDGRRGTCCVAPIGAKSAASCVVQLFRPDSDATTIHIFAVDALRGEPASNVKVHVVQLDRSRPVWQRYWTCNESGYVEASGVPAGLVSVYVDGASAESEPPYSMQLRTGNGVPEGWTTVAVPEDAGELSLMLKCDTAPRKSLASMVVLQRRSGRPGALIPTRRRLVAGDNHFVLHLPQDTYRIKIMPDGDWIVLADDVEVVAGRKASAVVAAFPNQNVSRVHLNGITKYDGPFHVYAEMKAGEQWPGVGNPLHVGAYRWFDTVAKVRLPLSIGRLIVVGRGRCWESVGPVSGTYASNEVGLREAVVVEIVKVLPERGDVDVEPSWHIADSAGRAFDVVPTVSLLTVDGLSVRCCSARCVVAQGALEIGVGTSRVLRRVRDAFERVML
ncbi:MAG: hypothetical protein H6832_02210 [Planctomycetes bacterium]|nr:hypothetical protein [Planctomycetota bacterium]